MEVDGAWSLHVSRERNWLIRPWVQGYKKHPILHAEWQYMDIEPRPARRDRASQPCECRMIRARAAGRRARSCAAGAASLALVGRGRRSATR